MARVNALGPDRAECSQTPVIGRRISARTVGSPGFLFGVHSICLKMLLVLTRCLRPVMEFMPMVLYVVLRRVFARASKTSIPIILGALVFVLAFGMVGAYLAEHRVNSDIDSFGDSLWWVLVTISTVGYGDKVPIILGGRTVAVVAMTAGPILLVSFVGMLGATFYDEWQKGAKGMSQVESKGHILICGWNATASELIAELRQSGVFNKTPVVITERQLTPGHPRIQAPCLFMAYRLT